MILTNENTFNSVYVHDTHTIPLNVSIYVILNNFTLTSGIFLKISAWPGQIGDIIYPKLTLAAGVISTGLVIHYNLDFDRLGSFVDNGH